MSRTYSERVMRFRMGVYAKRPEMTNGCRVLLLRLSDGMDSKCIVSVPRSTLADELGVAPARITEWIAQAKALGFLSSVRRGRPGVTAVYQGMIVAPAQAPEVRQGVPSQRYARADQVGVRQGVPQFEGQRYALGGSQVGNAQRGSAESRRGVVPDERRIYGEPGDFPGVDQYAVDRLRDEGREERSA